MILIPYLSARGFPAVGIWIRSKKYFPQIHHLVAEYFIPNPKNKQYVYHLDGNIWNNDVDNLIWVTYSELLKRAVADKRMKDRKGENAHHVFHTNKEIRHVCRLLSTGKTTEYVSNETDIPRQRISVIRRGRRWGSVSEDFTFPKKLKYVGVLRKNDFDRYSKETVYKICELLQRGKKPKRIAIKLNIPKAIVMSVKERRRWTAISSNFHF